ncbi:ubiquitin interaction motif protein (macronuclear) [Tetrahymena thermophila SB210]|uniref:Ubiquitin interaction motif protein n=1 Tax=Tetrahymena thermophila (strain SB210) TaxID=312017 RepID=I7M6L0_TETTS|nr:ubiquitin interaction motif protein [Tetrahymena thermophila SB210]EAR85404.1 ubiquitin interaction motif protein [Tetrahymena thermophila SB210]|eukprot:XP_001033067.1 ubiquitin interaction motif protein [Tetrahymena thermophila SB210]
MTLEASIVILDNTEYARNGDHLPSRYEAQAETIQAIINAKQQMNMENAVGILTMGGPQVEVLITPSADPDAILGCLFGVKLRGEKAHFLNALQIAQLGLKHRKNKNMRQRIIVFVASPIVEDEKTLERVAKQLKKNNVSVDIVNLCQSGVNQIEKLDKFIQTVNSGDSSYFLNVQSGITSLTETLFNSPILNRFLSGSNANQASSVGNVPINPTQAGGANPFAEYGGIDPSEDPELAQAMKLSLEEEKRIQEQLEREKNQQQQQQQAPSQPAQENATSLAQQNLNTSANNPSFVNETMQDENQGLLANKDDFDELTEEELMNQAILASQQENPFEAQQGAENKEPRKEQTKKEDDESVQANLMQDEKFVEDLLNLVGKGDEKKDDKKENEKK